MRATRKWFDCMLRAQCKCDKSVFLDRYDADDRFGSYLAGYQCALCTALDDRAISKFVNCLFDFGGTLISGGRKQAHVHRTHTHTFALTVSAETDGALGYLAKVN